MPCGVGALIPHRRLEEFLCRGTIRVPPDTDGVEELPVRPAGAEDVRIVEPDCDATVAIGKVAVLAVPEDGGLGGAEAGGAYVADGRAIDAMRLYEDEGVHVFLART